MAIERGVHRSPVPEALHSQATARLAAVFEAAVDAIVTIDEDGLVESFNPAACRLFGVEESDIIGQPVQRLMPSPFRENHGEYMRRYLTTGERRIIGIGREVQGQRSDGSTFPMWLSVAEVEVSPGERRCFVGIVRDISADKAAQVAREELIVELESKNAELERFTYTVSHDLKSPLITIKGFLGMVERDLATGRGDRVGRDLGRIGAAADRMKELLDELLELSRVGRLVNPPEAVRFATIVEDALALLSGPIRERGVHVDVDVGEVQVFGDRLRLVEVVQNLIDNAVKFSRGVAEPRVEVRCVSAAADASLTFVVRDNGEGIEAAYVRKVFGLFEQLDPNRPGTGVGLALVKRIIEVHGGRIWLESAGLGHGCAFFFTLPAPPASR